MTQMTLCGVPFSGDHEPIEGLIFSRLIDWDGVTEGRSEGDPIPTAHGSYGRTDLWRESRAISVEGAIITHSEEEFHTVRRRLEALPSFGEMWVDDGDGWWGRDVEIDRVQIPDRHWRTSVEFTIDLLAPDPVRYTELLTSGPAGLPERSGGVRLPQRFPWNFGTSVFPTAPLENFGELPVLPRVIVTGSADSITVHGGAFRMEFGAFDGVLVFDSELRRASLDGVDVTRDLIRRDWPQVAPGATSEFYFTAVGAAPGTELLVEYRIGVW